jgi:hypothetical protein
VLPRCSSGKRKEENGNPWDIHGNIFYKWSCFFWKNSISLEDFKADDRILKSDEWISSWDELPSGKRLQNELERSTMLFMGESTISTGPFSSWLMEDRGRSMFSGDPGVKSLKNPAGGYDFISMGDNGI